MSKVAITGNASGAGVFTIASPNSATDRTLTLPDETGTVITTASLNPLTSGTAVASTSGTSIDFTGIPSWVKRVTVMLSGVSTNGVSAKEIQIGDSGGFETTGYDSSASIQNGTAITSTTGFVLTPTSVAARAESGSIVLVNIGSNTWVSSGALSQNTYANAFNNAGDKTLSGTLDRIRLTAKNGTDTFDAGLINIMYE